MREVENVGVSLLLLGVEAKLLLSVVVEPKRLLLLRCYGKNLELVFIIVVVGSWQENRLEVFRFRFVEA